MEPGAEDNLATLAAIGLLAYLSADLAHHAVGHAGACWALHGQVERLSSVYVQCTEHRSLIDLAGPLANALVGIGALLVGPLLRPHSPSVRLLATLVAAFNLFWICLQLTFSAATRTDDWAWAMQEYQVTEAGRYALMLAGIAGYVWAIRAVGSQLAPFAEPIARVRRITRIAWVTAGVTAVASAALDPDAFTVVLHHAAPQSLLLSIGLLLTPASAARAARAVKPAAVLGLIVPLAAAAAALALLSIALLGPGIRLM